LNYNAREFIRELDTLTSDDFKLKGTSLGEGKGTLYVVTDNIYPKEVAAAFMERIPDHRILGCAYSLAKEKPAMKTVLVTKDVNLRMKARALGLFVEDYSTDKVKNIDSFEDTQQTYEDIDADLIDRIYSSHDGIAVEELNFQEKLTPNACFILKSSRNSVLARYNPFTGTVKKVGKGVNFGIQPRNAEQSFAFDILNDPDIKLVGITGKAGTGKTLLALASALKQAGLYKQILLARPIVSLANKDIGFLPGTEKEKVAPYMQPLFDNLNVIKGQFPDNSPEVRQLGELQKNNQLVIEALAFIRGRSLSDTFCIVDEAQNLTPHEIKTIVTRTGDGTKMVFTGDIQQIDSPYLDAESNGLAYLIDRMRGQSLFAHVNLVKGERSELAELAANLL
jgi:PhoH-like ATPase